MVQKKNKTKKLEYARLMIVQHLRVAQFIKKLATRLRWFIYLFIPFLVHK